MKIEAYDFRRPDRIGKEQLRSLQTLHDIFARNLAGALSGLLRNVVEVKISDVEQTTYADFRDALPRPTCISRIDPDELDGSLCVELSPLLVYPIVDRLMGGSAQNLFIPQRAMTFIEQQLIRQVVDLILAAMNEAWEGVRPVGFRIGEMETNPHVFQIALPNDVVVLLTFDVTIANRSGTMTVCYPFSVIEPVLGDLTDRVHSRHEDRSGGDHRRRVSDQVAHARVEMAAILAHTTITMSELRHLEIGDVIATDAPASSPITLLVEGQPKFRASIGRHRRSYAVRIVRRTDASDRQPAENAAAT